MISIRQNFVINKPTKKKSSQKFRISQQKLNTKSKFTFSLSLYDFQYIDQNEYAVDAKSVTISAVFNFYFFSLLHYSRVYISKRTECRS